MNPTNEQELREQLLREIAFYGDMCAQHQSTLHFGKFTVDQRNAAIRKSIYSQGLPELIQAHINAEIAKETTAARIDEIDWCRNEVENDIPINVYDKLSDRIAQLQKEVK